MEYQLQHDPRTKAALKEILYEHLYGPVLKQFKRRLDTIVTQNTLKVRAPHNSLIYKGEYYAVDTSPPPKPIARLDPSLKMQMDAYLQELHELNTKELPYVVGFITQVLNSSTSIQDYLELLPESIHQPLLKIVHNCPCRTCQLAKEEVAEIQKSNTKAIELLKQRLVLNLIT